MSKISIATFLLIYFNLLNAQISEIEGTLKLTDLQPDSFSTSFVVQQNDGTLAKQNLNLTNSFATGSIIMSEQQNDLNILNMGFELYGSINTQIGLNDSSGNLYGSWELMSTINAPSPRYLHSTIWTGSKMIVWGGLSSEAVNTGSIYDPVLDTWTNVSTVNAPEARYNHSAIWTGNKMIIWGGRSLTGSVLNDGYIYDPLNDSWSIIAVSSLESRSNHSAAWTGNEMIIWGGIGTSNSTVYNNGAKYSLSNNSWSLISTLNAPIKRVNYSSVWTGNEMIIWGGKNENNLILKTGSRYDPINDIWSAVNNIGAPSKRHYHSAIWANTEMIVWGGSSDVIFQELSNGKKYNPQLNSWTTITNNNPPLARYKHTMSWTGSEIIIWGGSIQATSPDSPFLNSGKKYNPTTNDWTFDTSTTNAPSPRDGCSNIWTGNEMIIWGGRTPSFTNTGSIYQPNDTGFAPIKNKYMYLYRKI